MLPLGGLSCCMSATALYLLGRSSGRVADDLNSAARINELSDLAQILDTACNVFPTLVSISGRVGSETPINCERSGLRAVIVEETAEQHFLKHNDVGSWIQDSALILSMCKEVPWFLDDGTGRVYVVGAREATGLVLTIASELLQDSGRSLVRGTLDYLQGLKMLGIKRVERVLPTGTALTVVGEAVKDDVGTLRIQRPHRGPFYVSPKTIDQLIENFGKWARLYKFASYALSVFGLCLLTKNTIQYILEKRRFWEFRKRVLDAAGKKADKGNSERDENGPNASRREAPIPDLCVICLDHQYNVVFVPCGHMCSCVDCSAQLTNCPLCRRRVDHVIRTFRH